MEKFVLVVAVFARAAVSPRSTSKRGRRSTSDRSDTYAARRLV